MSGWDAEERREQRAERGDRGGAGRGGGVVQQTRHEGKNDHEWADRERRGLKFDLLVARQ